VWGAWVLLLGQTGFLGGGKYASVLEQIMRGKNHHLIDVRRGMDLAV